MTEILVKPTEVAANSLKDTIRTTVPLKVAQRHGSSRLDDLVIQDLRIYGRALSDAEVEGLARSTRAAWLALKPADQRNGAEKDEWFAWWLPSNDATYRTLNDRLSGLAQEKAAIRSRGTVAHVMQERTNESRSPQT